ncbi:MAG: glycoside hydrolase family 3 C-terminal domain-containing protein [Clostridium sp.]|nr:glycoside hydrolase family 3 C-terminal domain-containing protein [Bacteroides sp.]MCM1197362.1 glycoside hydrolase family 3 C-terminal domain-containing protein [Clostridium sp.]
MKRYISGILAAGCAVFMSSCSHKPSPAIPADKEIESRISRMLKKMTLEDKVGQMTQLTVGMIMDSTGMEVDDAKLDELISKYRVGSILNVPTGVSPEIGVYHKVIRKIQDKSIRELGIPCLYGLDQIHGASYIQGAVFFPQEINIAATFDRTYARQMGEVTAYETRAALVPWTFSPVMDLGRNPLWSRMWESFGEDVYLNSEMAAAEVKGLQGDDPNHVGLTGLAACIKHYMGYGVPVSGKDRTPSSIGSRDLREKYFEPFRNCIMAGALSLMVNSSSNNGIPFHANRELITGWLKEDLAWDGLVVTDWNDINNLYSRDHVASSKKDAVKIAINAGIDMAMVPSEVQFCIDLKELVEEGAVPMSRIDDAVARVLRLKFRLGLFDNPVWDTDAYDRYGCEESVKMAFNAALESEVLLKNDGGLLPLKQGTKILLAGPGADNMRCLNGGWSYSWQGDCADDFAGEYLTVHEALCRKFGDKNVIYVPGVTYAAAHDDNWQEEIVHENWKVLAEAAEGADVIMACVGENTYCETPGNMNDLNLSSAQKELVRTLAATGKPLVLVLNEGRPRIISDIEPLADAIVDVMLPGNYGAEALAELLSGDANFSGRLPFTYPRHVNSFATYDYKVSENVPTMDGEYNYNAVMDIQWPFGYGLSYTVFEYSDFRADRISFSADDIIEFSVNVKNAGTVAGKEAVMLYSSDLVASSMPDVMRLRAFDKVSLAPGETASVTFRIKASDLAFVGYDGKWRLEEGDFRMRCGDRTLLVSCTSGKVWNTPNIL